MVTVCVLQDKQNLFLWKAKVLSFRNFSREDVTLLDIGTGRISYFSPLLRCRDRGCMLLLTTRCFRYGYLQKFMFLLTHPKWHVKLAQYPAWSWRQKELSECQTYSISVLIKGLISKLVLDILKVKILNFLLKKMELFVYFFFSTNCRIFLCPDKKRLLQGGQWT